MYTKNSKLCLGLQLEIKTTPSPSPDENRIIPLCAKKPHQKESPKDKFSKEKNKAQKEKENIHFFTNEFESLGNEILEERDLSENENSREMRIAVLPRAGYTAHLVLYEKEEKINKKLFKNINTIENNNNGSEGNSLGNPSSNNQELPFSIPYISTPESSKC